MKMCSVFVCLTLLFSASTWAEFRCAEGMQVDGEYIVRTQSPSLFQKKMSILSKSSTKNNLMVQKIFSSSKVSSFKVSANDVDAEEIKNDSSVLSVEPNCYFRSFSLPNDPEYEKNVGFNLINLPQAWSYATSSSVVVAVPDMGVDISHPDLSDNIWKNQKELEGTSGVDDDGNGYVDDFHGWGFPENNNDVTPGNFEGSGHGTHVAGIIGAVGNNNLGVTGVVWKIKLMPLRIFRKNIDLATTEDIIKSIYYAVDNGAQIINCSWGAEQKPSLAEKDAYAFAESKGVFVVAAGGNSSKDVSNYSPASINSVLAVGSINSLFELSTFSSHGFKIELLAPGGDEKSNYGFGIDEEIYSTTLGGYGYRRGTSVSTPFVSGVAALVKSFLPMIQPSEMIRLLKEGGDKLTIKVAGNEYQYTKLNAEKTLSLAFSTSLTQPDCKTNCAYSSANLNPVANNSLPAPVKFGGGCSLQTVHTRNASAGWDVAFLISFFFPSAISRFRRLRRRK